MGSEMCIRDRVISSVINSSNIDMYYGIGGAPEGVLAAAALQCIGGSIEGKLLFNNDDEVMRAKKTGITDLDKINSVTQNLKKTSFIKKEISVIRIEENIG